MTRQSLLEEIRRISVEKKLSVNKIAYEEFLFQPEFEYLKIQYDKYRLKNEKWHQLVRFALSDKAERRYMYDRLLQLLLRHRSSYNDYFKLKTESGTVMFPDRVSEINMLFSLYKEYFVLFKTIIQRIHFDYPTEKDTSNIIQGKINWEGTLKNSYTTFPLKFQLIKWHRDFVTPENVVLLLCAVLLNNASKTLLNIPFVEPLSASELNTLNYIQTRTRNIADFFPFQDVKAYAKKFYYLSIKDSRIRELERDFELRVSDGIVLAKSYYNLLQWWRKFKHMNVRLISKNRTNFPLETMKNLDTIYEAWIFFEFLDFVSRKGLLTRLEIDLENFFEFQIEDQHIKFFYEKKFLKDYGHAWAVDSFPDFTVMNNDEIIAVFDAKNYGALSESRGDATHKILAYLTNLDCAFGGLFFPNFETREFRFPEQYRIAKHHGDLHVGHFQMQPYNTSQAITSKNDSLAKIFDEIIERVKSATMQQSLAI